ncbi:MAG: DUF3006 domain-containing protein [Defluviitaleaceae bacterium]|nr:DUF3006 domain-containing protein [Defluviitaleaceae bacterium]MCL2262957.1 DUF3006 domain-containing protein [Defluviitaleaceae bacterium]
MDKQYPSLEQITRPAPRWVIDRFEEDWAVLDNSDTRETISLPISHLPKDAKPGTTLIKTDGKWHINEADTAARSARIKDKFARLKAK